ncbi:MAG: HAMP domain-containing histidine kinase [Myxococcales bacterium]|nr:HAMP domain-containing histidine kinase [Myxococcales bacterium]
MTKLLLAVVLPTVALFVVFAWVALAATRVELDAELGSRLVAIASSAATQVRGKYLIESSGDDDRGYVNARRKLRAIFESTGARLVVFDRDYVSKVDTEADAPGLRYYRGALDEFEIAKVWETGAPIASVSFVGGDGQFYKAGYAAVAASETEPQMVLVVAAVAPATYFARLGNLRRQLMVWGGLLVVLMSTVIVVIATLVTRPVRALAEAASDMGQGNFSTPISTRSRDEVGSLAESMESMRQKLAARDEHMQRMLAGIAHEVRNPLAGMELFTGLLREELPADAVSRGYADRISREIGHLGRVVGDFLDYAKPQVLQRERVVVAALLRDIAGVVKASPGVAIAIDVEDEALALIADPHSLRRAVLNLAQNAAHYAVAVAGEPAAVILVARAEGDEVQISVSNTGGPIAPDVAARLFEPFFTTREKGTGLGLALVRDAAQAHRGEVSVTSDERRTTFCLALPKGDIA